MSENQNILVSVIIPCYNAARFLAQAIESVLSQTFRSFEILVIDDGSTDDTAKIITSYGDRIRYCHQENRGTASARNLGITMAQGVFVAFLDADDIWLPNKLEIQLRLFDREPSLGVVYSDCYSIDEDGERTGFYLQRKLAKKRDQAEEIFIKDFIPNSSIIIRRSCFDLIGFHDETMLLSEDEDLKIRLADRFPIGYVNMPLAEWRQHEGNKSLMVGKLKAAFKHDTDIECRKVPRLERLRGERKAVLHENCGLLFIHADDTGLARREFVLAIRSNPRRFRSFLLYALSFFGSHTVNLLIQYRKKAALKRAAFLE
jgi:glycosyltransferase involved in cell wall biosynthesis